MSRPRVATVLSARPWEARLAAAAHRSGLVRLVGRIYQPIELSRLDAPDWLVVGAETAWLDPLRIEAIRSAGTAVVGVHAEGDEPSAHRLIEAGADVVATEAADPADLLRRLVVPPPMPEPSGGGVLAVVGPRGAGATTVAIGLAGGHRDLAIIDTDSTPGVGPMLGLAPPTRRASGPEDLVHSGTELEQGPTILTIGALDAPPTLADATRAVTLAGQVFARVIVDAPPPFDRRVGWCADEVVLVLDASVQGLLRGMGMIERWEWPIPRLVLNRVVDEDATDAARDVTGLEPDGLIPLSLDPIAAAREALATSAGARGA